MIVIILLYFQAGEFFFFAGLSACIFVIFVIMSYFYKYVQDEKVEKEMGDTIGLIKNESDYVSDEENQNAAKNEL